jgi:hypothetical protein
MVVFTEGRHPGEGLLSEASGQRSRETVTIVSGSGILAAGTVLGQITTGGKYAPSPATGSDGSQVAAAILLYGVDAASADVKAAVIKRDAEWNGNTLSYAASVDDDTKKAAKATQLAAVGIIVRN